MLLRRTALAHLAAGAASWPAWNLAQTTRPVAIAVPDDVAKDYARFVAGRPLARITQFDGPHARRDVVELALFLRELARTTPELQAQLRPIDSYQRSLVEVSIGRVAALGTSAWQTDLQKTTPKVLLSEALIPEDEFRVGLYTVAGNRKALAAHTVQALRELRFVSNSDWSADWTTLQAMGLPNVANIKTWRQMVYLVARGRADVLLAPFPNTPSLRLVFEDFTLEPLEGRALALKGSRHLAAANNVDGQRIANTVFPALAALGHSGALRRAYTECGFYNPQVAGWHTFKALNLNQVGL
ncbi:MAG: hypothetical protein U5M53_04245 [Rhodoferax sp.]|nr:hypothetical protein [Rhodoferax sp.]